MYVTLFEHLKYKGFSFLEGLQHWLLIVWMWEIATPYTASSFVSGDNSFFESFSRGEIYFKQYSMHISCPLQFINIPLQKDHLGYISLSLSCTGTSHPLYIGDTANKALMNLLRFCPNCPFLFVSFISTFISIQDRSRHNCDSFPLYPNLPIYTSQYTYIIT